MKMKKWNTNIVSKESENDTADEPENLLLSENEVSNEENEYVKDLHGQSSVRIGELQSTHAISDYENNEDELNIPTIINDKTEFKKLKWCVGIVFPNSFQFREAVIRYAIAQGRNVKIDVRDKKRLDMMGDRCVEGCSFKIYTSWDNKLASYIVKSVDGKHTCHRNMESNKQFKASCCAKQLLELFKSKPDIPSSELVDIVRKNYRIIISRDFAYKVKYAAHKKLHGSMKQHCSKVMSYLEALKKSSPNSHFTITTLGNTIPPIFQRFFVCFEGVKDGWLNGCRKLLCIGGCFLKTFFWGNVFKCYW